MKLTRDNSEMTNTAIAIVVVLVIFAISLAAALGGAMEASHLYYSHERRSCT